MPIILSNDYTREFVNISDTSHDRQLGLLKSVQYHYGVQGRCGALSSVLFPRQVLHDRIHPLFTRNTGVLFICFNVDHRLLYNLSEDAIMDGFQFYTTFFNAPPAIKVLLQ